jgi:hypothetical protein
MCYLGVPRRPPERRGTVECDDGEVAELVLASTGPELPPGIKWCELERKARQAETAAYCEWLESPALQPPK